MSQIDQYLQDLQDYSIMPFAIPILLGLAGLEFYISRRKNIKVYDTKDAKAASIIGLINVGLGLLLKTINFTFLLFFYTLIPWRIEASWWSFILCFITVDFMRYWANRIAHEKRLWWATHVTHHSSKQFNFTVAFRLGWTQNLKIVFFVPIMLAGFDPIVFFICHQVAVLYQFWIHSPFIKKLWRPIEFLLVTPSHHRVHHGTNPEYIDKNYGSTFIIWDRVLGTFAPETAPVVYGITKPLAQPYNPVYLVFHEWKDLLHDVVRCSSLKMAWKVMFSAPGSE